MKKSALTNFKVKNSKSNVCGIYKAKTAGEAAEMAIADGHKPNPKWLNDWGKPRGFDVIDIDWKG